LMRVCFFSVAMSRSPNHTPDVRRPG